jgi:tripartite ATP-independent transporter DctM subunit
VIVSLEMIGLLVLLFAVGVPVAVALGTVGILGILDIGPRYLPAAGHAVWNTVDNYVLLSVPLFVLMGELFQRSNLAYPFYRAASRWVAWLPGGLLHSNIFACSLFSAISGSSVATAATIGAIAVPEMERLGYNRRKVFGSLAGGGTLGILIPPSIPLILYAALVDASVGKLFAAAIVPGIVLTLCFFLYIFVSSLWSRTATEPFVLRQALLATADLIPIAILIVLVLGSIYTGVATPTEAAAVGVCCTLLLMLGFRVFRWSILLEALRSTTRFTCIIFFIVIGAQIFSYAVFRSGAPRELQDWIAAVEPTPWMMLSVIMLGYLILGMFVDAISIMVLTVSIVHPLILGLGYDTIWFGIVLVVTLEIGLITPPLGLNLFTIQATTRGVATIGEISLGALPYVVIMIFFLAVMTVFPQLVLWPAGLFQ